METATIDTGRSTEPDPGTFGGRLAAARKAAGLTQEQLGKGLGAEGGDLGKGAVSAWERNSSQPSSDQLALICPRLRVSADHLLGLEG